jgi:hypothetical protein
MEPQMMPLHHLGISFSETPSDNGNLFMPNNDGVSATEVMQNSSHVVGQELDVVL